MQETQAELERLQALLDESIEKASPFLRSSFEMPAHSLSASQLSARLQGSLTAALATVTARGEPRVTPITAFFLHGHFWVPTVAEAARARHLARRPGVSLTYYESIGFAVLAHGTAAIIRQPNPEFAELDATQRANGKQSPTEWEGEAVYLRIDGARLYTYVREPP